MHAASALLARASLYSAAVTGVRLHGSIGKESRNLENHLIERPKPRKLDVQYDLKHFAVITFAVPADKFQIIFPGRFQADAVEAIY